MFKKMTHEQFDQIEEFLLFQEISDFISKQVEDDPYDFSPEKISQLPQVAQNIFYVWWFSCEVGGNGYEDYLLQHAGKDAPGAHAGLRAMGADFLLKRLEAAIPISIEWEPEYTTLEDWSWYKQFKLNPEFPSIETIDTMEMYNEIAESLTQKAISYILNNKDILVE